MTKIRGIWRKLGKAVRYYKLRFKATVIVGKRVNIGSNVTIGGKGVIIGSNVTFVRNVEIMGPVRIADNVVVAANTLILGRDHDISHGMNALPYGTGYKLQEVVIERNVWIGQYVIILPGVRVGEGSIIASGSVVTRDVPGCSVIGGNPARIIKKRDKDLYDKLSAAEIYINDIRGSSYNSVLVNIRKAYLARKLLKRFDSVSDVDIDSKSPHRVRGLLYKLHEKNKSTILEVVEGNLVLRKKT